MNENKVLIPGAIILAALIIGIAVFFSANKTTDTNTHTQSTPTDYSALQPVTGEDHITGNPNAPIKIIEFSDIDCPFCAQFHQTLKQIVAEYGIDGEVAWVYRHFPITRIHPNSFRKSVATECVAELGGNQTFWQYLDTLFERDDEAVGELGDIATTFGIDKEQFDTCASSGKYNDKIQNHSAQATGIGAEGTPHSVIVLPSGEVIEIRGAQPIEVVRQLLSVAMQSLEVPAQ